MGPQKSTNETGDHAEAQQNDSPEDHLAHATILARLAPGDQ